jgi:hypothetical protein
MWLKRYESQNCNFPYALKADWYLYVPAAMNIRHFAFCIYEFLMHLGLNGDYFLKQHYAVDLCIGEVWCSL